MLRAWGLLDRCRAVLVRDALRCGSWLVYSTYGRSFPAICVRHVIVRLKLGQVEATSGRSWADLVIERFASHVPFTLRQLFESPVTLVPVPRCTVTAEVAGVARNDVWPAAALCRELCRRGLGNDVQALLRRVRAVPKSAWEKEDRPSVDVHFQSFAVAATPRTGARARGRLLLVDDVVTRGATLLGAARRVRMACPGARIEAFALAHVEKAGVVGQAGQMGQAVQPCLEQIVGTATGCVRVPCARAPARRILSMRSPERGA
jgi:predicted amidophosphoribosyltransferase